MKTPHSPGGKWPAIENPKLKGLHSTTCDLCNKGNSNLGFRTAFSSSDYQTILFSVLTMIHSHSGFYRNWNNKQLNSGFVYHPLISHSIRDRQTILFRQGLFLCFRISFGSFVFFFLSPGTFLYLGFWLVKFLHWFFIILFHFQHQFWRFPAQCSDFAAQPSPAEHLAEELTAGTSTRVGGKGLLVHFR